MANIDRLISTDLARVLVIFHLDSPSGDDVITKHRSAAMAANVRMDTKPKSPTPKAYSSQPSRPKAQRPLKFEYAAKEWSIEADRSAMARFMMKMLVGDLSLLNLFVF